MNNHKILNYKIINLIGEGGMGKVYLAVHEKLNRKVALKILNPVYSGDVDIRERFLNEAIALSKLNHNNIVTLFDFSEDSGNLFLIMEFVEGKSLDLVISEQNEAFTEIRCNNIFNQILNGFSYAHSKGIIHRDIKPSNIILQPDDTPKILDFGIAKIVEGDKKLTKAGTRMGSVAYMSPEQVLGNEVDLRSDIYSLGVTYFEMLTGSPPYYLDNKSEYEIQHSIIQENLPSVCDHNSNLSDRYDKIIQKATAKNSADRFNNCEEFSKSLLGDGELLVNKKTTIQNGNLYTNTKISPVYSSQTPILKRSNNMIYILIVVIVAVVSLLFYMVSRESAGTDISSAPVIKDTKSKITDNEVRSFVKDWAYAQSNKMISEYVAMYDPSFSGIKRTKSGKIYNLGYSDWISDRSAMYNKAQNLSITYTNLDVRVTSDFNAEVTFKQFYYSAQYSDEGHKVLRLKKDSDGKIKIIFEELIYSTTGY